MNEGEWFVWIVRKEQNIVGVNRTACNRNKLPVEQWMIRTHLSSKFSNEIRRCDVIRSYCFHVTHGIGGILFEAWRNRLPITRPRE